MLSTQDVSNFESKALNTQIVLNRQAGIQHVNEHVEFSQVISGTLE